MDHLPFFHPDAVADLIGASIELALIYKCDPYRFLDLGEHEVAELYRLTAERLRVMREE